MRSSLTILVCTVTLLSLWSTPARALSWSPGWTLPAASGPRAVVTADSTEARRLGDAIDSPASTRAAIQAWEAVAAAEPNAPEAWIELGSLHLLEGAAYRSRAKDRLTCYVAALQACERAMATNPEFLQRVQAGQTVGLAAAALGPREIGAIHFWITGVFYIFRDCLGFFGRIGNVKLMDRAKEMLQRMDAIDPTWEEHTSTFSWGIYYLALPVSRGGDRTRARECFDRAVALGTHRTLPRWGRGKYYYVATGEAAAAQADLAAVAARDLAGLGGSRAWNRYIQREAAGMLTR